MSFKDLQKFQDKQHAWAEETFGKHRDGIGTLYHLREEVKELIFACEETNWHTQKQDDIDPDDLQKRREEELFEFADCFLLLMDAAACRKVDIETLIAYAIRKREINANRKWGKPDENGVVRHIKENE